MAETELMELEVAKMIRLLRKNKVEFFWTLAVMPVLNPNVAIHRFNLNPNIKSSIKEEDVYP